MTLTLLLTGFGPFPGAAVNPTAALVRRLARLRVPGDVRRIAHVFPTRYEAVDRDLPALLARHRPDAVVLFGLAPRRAHVSIETLARNRRSIIFPDAGGGAPAGVSIDAGGVPHQGGRAPMRWLLAAARGARVETRLSRDAGGYLCNYAYWRALAAADRDGAPRIVVFVHVPKLRPTCARMRAGRRRYAMTDIVRAGEALVRAVIAAARAPH